MQATAEAPETTAEIAAPEAPTSTVRPKRPKAADIPIRRITVAEYYRMGEAGILGPEERVELLDGVLIEMPPGGPPHAYSIRRMARYFYERFSDRASVSVQAPMALDAWSEPEPDVMLSDLPEEQYSVAHPKPSQALLVVEVAVSSLRYDAGAKLRAYARRGVREYWIVDVEAGHIDVYCEPRGERYKKRERAKRGSSIAPLAFPGDAIAVNDILPPPR
jgi:Uma2 family endonuclease